MILIALPLIGFVLGFSVILLFWLVKERMVKKNRLYGYNLKDWFFLGHSTARYVTEDGRTDEEMEIALFCHRKTGIRKYVMLSDNKYRLARFARHPFILKGLSTWAVGLKGLNSYVMSPSTELLEYEHKRGQTWDSEKKCWRPIADTTKEGNVIWLGKKK